MENQRNFILTLIILILTSFISSCGTMPGMSVSLAKKEAAKLRPAYQRFQALCNADHRVIVSHVKEVSGYLFADASYGADCNRDGWEPLFKNGYSFHECSTGKFSNYGSILNGNLFRFYISNWNDIDCVYESDFINNKLSKYSSRYYENKNIIEALRSYKEKLKDNQCLAKKMVQKPKSNYAKILEFGYVDSKGKHHLGENPGGNNSNIIGYHGYSIIDIKRKERLVVLNRKYSYTPETNDKYIGSFKCEIRSKKGMSDILIPN